MAKILIKNGRVWDGEKFFDSDVLEVLFEDGEELVGSAVAVEEDEREGLSVLFEDASCGIRLPSSLREKLAGGLLVEFDKRVLAWVVLVVEVLVV